VVVLAQLTLTPLAFVTTLTTAWASLTLAAFATVQERFTSAVVPTSQWVTATVMATSSTPLACVVVLAQLTLTPMASATTLTTA
jgi:hypothetical protein